MYNIYIHNIVTLITGFKHSTVYVINPSRYIHRTYLQPLALLAASVASLVVLSPVLPAQSNASALGPLLPHPLHPARVQKELPTHHNISKTTTNMH